MIESLGDLVEQKVGYQVWSDGFDAGGPRLRSSRQGEPLQGKRSAVDLASYHSVDAANIHEHFIEALPQRPLVKNAGSKRNPNGTKVRGRSMKLSAPARR